MGLVIAVDTQASSSMEDLTVEGLCGTVTEDLTKANGGPATGTGEARHPFQTVMSFMVPI